MIDLCNKMEQIRITGDHATLQSPVADSPGNVSIPLDALTTEQREIVELAYHSALVHPNPLMHVVGDPAAWESSFGHALDRVAVRLDARSDAELRQQSTSHPDPMMREQALFEYADRNHGDAIEFISEVVVKDSDRQLRWDALWAMEKLGGVRAIQAL